MRWEEDGNEIEKCFPIFRTWLPMTAAATAQFGWLDLTIGCELGIIVL